MAKPKHAKRDDEMGQAVDAITMLKEDHRRVRDLFQEYKAADDLRVKWELAAEACTELEIHTQLEEQIFYPTVNEETDDGPELVKDSLDEHETMKNLIQELRDMGPDHKAFDTKFKKLIQNVEHHVEEEENEMFPLAEEELEEDMAKLREEMQELKQEIMAS